MVVSQKTASAELAVQMIPVDCIHVVNPRVRNRGKHKQIIDSIAEVGLKKPITMRPGGDDGTYELVCGQGRLEAFLKLGYPEIPAFVRDISHEDLLLISLVENIARRKPTSMELVRRLKEMRDQGYSTAQIAKKVNLVQRHVNTLLFLLDHGEQRLIAAVDQQRISITAAAVIAHHPDADVQAALAQAFEEGKLTKMDLKRSCRVADYRRAFGKANVVGKSTRKPVTKESILQNLRKETEQSEQAMQRAELCGKYLALCQHTLRELFNSEEFVALLRTEGLDTIPETIYTLIQRDPAGATAPTVDSMREV